MQFFSFTKNLLKKIPPSSIIGFGISAVLFWLMLRESSLDWLQVKTSLNNPVSAFYMVLSAFLFVFIVLVHSLRVRVIFIDKKTSLKDISAYSSLVIGNLYNCLLPGNLGEGIRAWHFSKVNKKSITESISIFVTEKILSSLLSLPLFIFAVLYFPFVNHEVQYSFLLLIGLILIFYIVLFAIYRYKRFSRVLFQLIPFSKFRKTIYKTFIHFQNHCKRMWKIGTLKYFLSLGYIMFVLNIVQYYFVLKAVGVPLELQNFSVAFIISLSMMIIMVIPSAPGNIGVAHYGVFLAMLLMAEIQDIETNALLLQKFALVGICVHFSYFIPEILIGIFYLLKDYKRVFQFESVKI